MNFVSSNATEVEEDDEPLFEIKKVSILRESKPIKLQVPNKVRLTTYKKICYVPLCPNTSVSTPQKMFITIPVNPFRRKLWLDAVGKQGGKNPKSPMFCCQDHFNLERDMINYEEHVCRGKVQMLLHKSVVPHIFLCNDYGHLPKTERIEILQNLHPNNGNSMQEVKGEEYIDNVIHEKPCITKNRRRQKLTRKVVEPVKARNTVFIEMPSFEHEDQPDYIAIKENGIETIIIDDSDSEQS